MSHKRKVLRGSVSNILRVFLSMLVSLVLPPFLVHRLSPAEYSAWVLILQLGAYVSLLDFGLQTAIGKFVAEHDAAGNQEASHHVVSTSFTVLATAALIASAGLIVLIRLIPNLFHQMPAALIPEVRLGVLAVGLSTAFSLPFSAFTSVFTGLQQYAYPTIIAVVARVGSAAVLIVLLLVHGSLVQMALVMAVFNVAAALAQYVGWRKFARHRVAFSFFLFHRKSAVQLAKYGSVLSLWTVAMLLISGLDTVIVGHYDYKNTGFYAIASNATNAMLMLISSVFGPLLPALSSMHADSTPQRLGELCIRTTRYCTLLLCGLGLPLFFGAYPLLTWWVGKGYASGSVMYVEVLVAGNVIRQLAFPYVITVVATGKQHLASTSAIAEAAVNVALSIFLVQRFGAIGVAVGTLAGALVSLAVHLLVSMHYTSATIFIQRNRFLTAGLFRPLLTTLPSLLLLMFWRQSAMLPANPWILAAWLTATVTIAWTLGLNGEERLGLKNSLFRLIYWQPAQG